jgi:hypothetical protein
MALRDVAAKIVVPIAHPLKLAVLPLRTKRSALEKGSCRMKFRGNSGFRSVFSSSWPCWHCFLRE